MVEMEMESAGKVVMGNGGDGDGEYMRIGDEEWWRVQER